MGGILSLPQIQKACHFATKLMFFVVSRQILPQRKSLDLPVGTLHAAVFPIAAHRLPGNQPLCAVAGDSSSGECQPPAPPATRGLHRTH